MILLSYYNSKILFIGTSNLCRYLDTNIIQYLYIIMNFTTHNAILKTSVDSF